MKERERESFSTKITLAFFTTRSALPGFILTNIFNSKNHFSLVMVFFFSFSNQNSSILFVAIIK